MSEEGRPDILPLSLSIISLIWYTVLWTLGSIGIWTARRRYRLRPRSPLSSASPTSVPGVSILRPLKGLDANLYENLESTFTQEYPNYELLLAVEDEDDQALSVVRELMAKYPGVNARAVVGMEVIGVNPKINNLLSAYRQAVNDILWVIDSNVMVDPGTLARAVDALDGPPTPSNTPRRRIAVVHHVPFAFATERTLGSRIEEAFLNTNHAKMYLALNAVAIDSCVVGKSNLYRKSDVDRIDGTLKPMSASSRGQSHVRGFPTLARYLAEDNMLASALWHQLDVRHELSCDVAHNAVGNMSLSDYIWRRVRWIRVRKHMVLSATLLEPFTESVLAGILAFLGLRYLIGVPAWFFFFVHFSVWLSVDLDVYASLAGHPLPFGRRWLAFVAAWGIRECLAFPIWVLAVCGSTIEWRGTRYVVLANGEGQRVGSDYNTSSRRSFWDTWRRKAESYEPLELTTD